MKINNKMSLVMIGSILLIANAIPIGRYLSEKQATNDVIKATSISSETTRITTKGEDKNAQTLPTNKLSNTSISSTSFAGIGPTTNLNIKLTGPGSFCGISAFTFFLKYSTWEKKLIIQSNGIVATMWNAVNHEITVGGDDSKTIEVAGTKIADTEVRIKSSGQGWTKMSGNKDLKWPKGLNSTTANTTYLIDSTGSEFNPNISFYYHIKGYGNFKVTSYDIFSFSTWLKDHLFAVIMGIIALIVIIISVIAAIATMGAAAAAEAEIAELTATNLDLLRAVINATYNILEYAGNGESAEIGNFLGSL